jgi:hypothetical protein
MNRLLYKPVGIGLGVLAGTVAGTIFRRVWRALSHEDSAPHATDEMSSWGEVLSAAALQGAIFALVRAAFDRGGAAGFRRVTGEWPTGHRVHP